MTTAMFLSPHAGRGLGEGRRGEVRRRRSRSHDPQIDIGGTARPSHPSPRPLATGWGEDERVAA
jgi:hypothetical protein